MDRHFIRNIILPIIMSVASLAHGQACQDTLALQHEKFPARELFQLMPQGSCLGTLDWTFGTRISAIQSALISGKLSKFRVHFFNGPGLRNGQLGKYEPHSGQSIKSFDAAWKTGGGKMRVHLRDRVKLFCQLFDGHPGVTLEMSPTLEHNLSSQAFKEQAAVIRKNCPRAVVIDNPVGGVSSTPGYKIERHGVAAKGLKAPCNVSLDGDDVMDVDVCAFLKANPQCAHYIWSFPYNGRLKKGDFIDPRKRNRWPSTDQLKAYLALAKDRPAPPALATCQAVKRPRLLKPEADDHAIGDVRANKPMWLTPYKGKTVEITTAAGVAKPIGTMAYYGPFDGGGFRYYSGTGSNLSGIAMADKAVALSGSPYVVVKEGNGACFGPILPYERNGYAR